MCQVRWSLVVGGAGAVLAPDHIAGPDKMVARRIEPLVSCAGCGGVEGRACVWSVGPEESRSLPGPSLHSVTRPKHANGKKTG